MIPTGRAGCPGNHATGREGPGKGTNEAVKTNPLPKFSMDRITALLRSRPDCTREILKAFGWRFHGAHGWVADLYIEGHTRLAILDMRTLSWRVGPKGRRDTWRGWLAESFRWYFALHGVVSEVDRYRETARIVQCITGPWPELQAACDELASSAVARSACAPMGHNQHSGGETPGVHPATTQEMAKAADESDMAKVSTVDTSEAGEQVSFNDTQAEDGVITVITQQHRPLLECHSWPYEPDQAPNVTPFLRPWRGPRGDGGAA